MKQLFLHIGMPKTGSSAIQSWLSAKADAIRSGHGFSYADLAPQAKQGNVTSGNGGTFVHFCLPHRRPEGFTRANFLRSLHGVYFAGADRCIVSSEVLAASPPAAIAELAAVLDAEKVSVAVIAFVRSLYDHCWSSYHQAVKRRGYHGTFDEYVAGYSNPQVSALRAWSALFRDVKVLNYDARPGGVVSAFLGACGIPPAAPDALAERRVNRSLTAFELQFLRGLNEVAARNGIKLGKRVSNAILSERPNEKACFLYDPRIAADLETRFAADVKWVNDRFPMDTPLGIDTASGRETRGMDPVEIPGIYAVAFDAVIKQVLLKSGSSRVRRARRRLAGAGPLRRSAQIG